MKRLYRTAIALIWVCVALSLVSCGPQTAVTLYPNNGGYAVDTQPTTDPVKDIGQHRPGTNTAKELAMAVTVSEQLLYNQDGIEISVLSFKYNGSVFGPTLTVQAVNTTPNDVSMLVKNASVNGVAASATAWLDVPSGNTVTGDIVFHSSALESAGVIVYGEIALSIRVLDSATLHNIIETDMLYIKTSAASYIQATDNAGKELYNQGGLRLVLRNATSAHDYYGAAIYVYAENNSENGILLTVAHSTINGIAVNPVFSCYVAPASFSYDCVGYMPYDIVSAGIVDIASATANVTFAATDPQTGETLLLIDAEALFDPSN